MRDPSIHITRSSLLELLKKKKVVSYESVADYLIKKGYENRLRSRYIIYGRTKLIKEKLERKRKLVNDNVAKFNLILNTIREKSKHKFIKIIRTNDKEYDLLREIVQFATDFIKLFKLTPIEEGYKIYIQIGLELMGKKYGLNKFKFYNSKIHEVYENMLIVDSDDDEEATHKFYEDWKSIMLSRVGVEMDFYKDKISNFLFLSKYVHIVFARQEADRLKADYKNWIEAQFDQLAWLNTIPELSQYHGQNAIDRYEKYMTNKWVSDMENRSLIKAQSIEEKNYWEALKDRRVKK